MKTVPKKLLSLTAAAMMLANVLPASVISAAAAETAVRGDVNGDGKIDKQDRAALVELLGSTCETLFSEGDRIPYDVSGDGFVDPRDLYALDCWFSSGTAFPEETGVRIEDTVTLALGGGACLPGEEVSLDLSVVDWTKDITGFEIMVYFDSRAFSFEEASYYSAEGITVCEGEGVKLTGLYGDQSLWRGKLASLKFRAKSSAAGEYEFAVRGANLYTSGYDIYTSVKDTGTVTVDTLFAPTAPELTGISSKSAALCWDMPFASEQAAGYTVFRDGKAVGETADTLFTDTGLEPDKDYVYTVQAKTAAGELTEMSRSLTVHTAVPKIESASFPAEVITAENGVLTVKLADKMLLKALDLTFTAADGTKTQDTVKLDGMSADAVQYQWNLDKAAGGDYTVAVTVTDLDGAKDSAETAVKVHTAAQAPSPVTVKAVPGSRSVTLTWSIAQEADAAGYYVYQKDGADGSFVPVAQIKDRATLSTLLSGLESGKEYFFAVTAYDVYGTESAMSEPVSAIPDPDTGNPEITYFIPKTGQRIAGQVRIEIRAKDDSAVTKVVCEIAPQPAEDSEAEPEWETLFEAAGSQLSKLYDTTQRPDGNYILRAMAYDADGNATSGENTAVIQTDNIGPAQVQGLRTEAVYPTQATLAWDNVPDADFSYFRVVISNGASVDVRTVSGTLGLNLSNLTPEVLYSVTVCAVDQTGNFGPESEPIMFVTEADTTAPVITRFTVSSDYVGPASGLTVGVTATDTAAVTRRMLQYSQDQENWKTLMLTDLTRDFYVDCKDMTDGPLYLRAYAQDSYGNAGKPEDAVIQTVNVDATAPAMPASVTAEPDANGILIKWEKSPSEDAVYYIVKRYEDVGKTYYTLADKTTSLSFLDKSAEFDLKYTYQVYAVDRAMNLSTQPRTIETVRQSDDVKPTFRDATISGSVVCDERRTFQIIAQDNVKLAEASLGFRLDDAETVTPLESEIVTNESGSQMRLTAVLPDAVFAAKSVTVIANAKDTAGNAADTAEYTYQVDNSTAKLSDLTVTPQGNTVLVSWKATETEKTRAMYVYRKVGEAAEQAIASIRLGSEDGSYSYTDKDLSKSGTYVYRIYAVQQSGHGTSLTAEPMEIHSVPKAKLICDTAQMVGAAYHFDGRGSENADEITKVTIDYGDGTVAAADSAAKALFEHTYENIGTYNVVLTCTNEEGGEGSCTVTVTVTAPSDLAKVRATVTATDGSAASYATVYVDLGTDSQMKYETDENGVVEFAATPGEHQVGVFGNGYLPASKNCTFIAGADNEISFSVVVNQLVDATFNITRMTLEEIKAAGINVADPANTHVVKINVQASYQSPDADNLSIIYDFDSGVHVVQNTDERYRYYVQAVRTKKKEIQTVVLLRIPAEVSFLKEFFNVEMVVINNASSEFNIDDCSVSLNVPSGMTLMSDAAGSAAQTEPLGTIRGGSSKTVNWILRGDVRGSYRISADFEGTLAGFDEHVSQRFEAEQPIEVRGKEQATIAVNIDTAIRGGGLMVEMLVKNNSDAPLYNVSTDMGNPIVEALNTFTGKADVKVYQTRFIGTDGIIKVLDEKTNTIETLNPGESFSVLYRIYNFSKEYAFRLLKYLRGTLDYSATSSNVTVQVTSDVRYVNVNSIFYGIKFDKDTQYLLAFRNKAGKELSGVTVHLYQFKNGQRIGEVTGTTDERGRLIVARQPAGENYYIRAELDGYEHYFTW